MAAKKYTISDGELVLTIEKEDRWFVVTSPTDPALITQARTIEEVFTAARDALAELAASRADVERWKKPQRRSRKSA